MIKRKMPGRRWKGMKSRTQLLFFRAKGMKKRRDLKGKQVCGWMGGAEGAP